MSDQDNDLHNDPAHIICDARAYFHALTVGGGEFSQSCINLSPGQGGLVHPPP